MKKTILLFISTFTLLVTSCDNEKHEEVAPDDPLEYKYIRVMVSDEITNAVSVINTRTGETQSFEARFPKSATYQTASGRFGVLVNTANNYVQLFDSGFEGHGDHVDVKGTPKWAAIIGDGNKPTHFKSKGNEIILFNDGDGTLDIGNESDFHVTGKKLSRINAGIAAHHGAMAKFDNGTYAITEKDGSVAGTLPERVKIIDASGKTVFASTLQTKGIHGNATNGKVAVFGSSSGILVIEQGGNQKLIPHPNDFGTAWFSSILEARGAGKFIGYTAAAGAYLIDALANTVTPILANTDIMQCKIDYAGNNLVVLLHSGEVSIYDLATNKLKKSAVILPATLKTETQKPQLEATAKYLYVTQPKSGEILQIPVSDLSSSKKIKVSATPYRLSILGIESSEDH